MADGSKAIQDIYTLFIQDDTISEEKKSELSVLYKAADTQPLFLAKLISFGMERQFVKRDARNHAATFWAEISSWNNCMHC